MTREEVPPLASDLDEGADKEANSLAGGAWGDGGVVVGASHHNSSIPHCSEMSEGTPPENDLGRVGSWELQ